MIRRSVGLIISGDAWDGAVLFVCHRRRTTRTVPARQDGPREHDRAKAAALTASIPTAEESRLDGENWNAVSQSPVAPGGLVEIVGLEGLTLRVKPKS